MILRGISIGLALAVWFVSGLWAFRRYLLRSTVLDLKMPVWLRVIVYLLLVAMCILSGGLGPLAFIVLRPKPGRRAW